MPILSRLARGYLVTNPDLVKTSGNSAVDQRSLHGELRPSYCEPCKSARKGIGKSEAGTAVAQTCQEGGMPSNFIDCLDEHIGCHDDIKVHGELLLCVLLNSFMAHTAKWLGHWVFSPEQSGFESHMRYQF